MQDLQGKQCQLRVHCSKRPRGQELVSRYRLCEEYCLLSVASYCRMREVMEEAIQRLYWACRQGSGFPGDIPEESAGSLTTDTILRGLSLIDPADDGCATTIARTESDASPDRETDKDHFRRASAARVSARTDSTLSTESSIMPSPISHNGPRSNSSPSQQVSSATTIPAYDETICSQQQHLYESMPMLNYHANMGRLNTSVASSVAGYDENIESYLNVDAFQDPPRSVLPDASGAFTLSPKHHQVNVGANMLTLPQQQTASAPMCDGYLAPWPGSLAAAYQSVSAV